ncbi:TetR/AcrR family transcriptional regulator [Spiractinospora alimapuensis]|uniref:TetR/AcrR family transcriptional regulator n=1 Tax=Spiractinospora alimapuensis TaxID=2820884 RepID=UPI001F1BBB8E|nr:TetR/AcrR family transcriptional regulator [Spiractinospora alimapuensis]QVQ54352.1 TetR/AcrR family transcriptional regulator [Spiractinospora alimapuensis]
MTTIAATRNDGVRVLDAADELFYAHGIQAVGMHQIRDASQIPLKRIYRVFPSKAELVEAYLRRRDHQARAALRAHTATPPTPERRILSVFDWLYTWYQLPEFRGCVFNNAFGELGGTDAIGRAVRKHMSAIREHLHTLAADTTAPDPAALAMQLHVLVCGATSLAAIHGDPTSALHARTNAEALLASLPERTAP